MCRLVLSGELLCLSFVIERRVVPVVGSVDGCPRVVRCVLSLLVCWLLLGLISVYVPFVVSFVVSCSDVLIIVVRGCLDS